MKGKDCRRRRHRNPKMEEEEEEEEVEGFMDEKKESLRS